MTTSIDKCPGKTENQNLQANSLFDVSHVTAVVTGGGTGIGLMITQALQSNSAKVYITGRRNEVLEETVKRYSTGPGSIHALTGDVSTKDGCVKLAQTLESKEPKGIHLLVNNAGIARDDATKYSSAGQPDMKDAKAISEHFLKSEQDEWANTFQTNVAGAYYMSMALLPLLARGRDATPGYTSQVVNITSISGVMKGPSGGQPIYATSKAAATQLSRVLAALFTEVGIRVNTITPGIFPSEMTAGSSGEDNKSTLDMKLSNPSGRTGHDTDMGATILFLAGKGGLFYNGQILYPDGGSTLVQPAANN
ncbi:hypothetical protein PFICI_12052 [Pestalotiopsis fici W106-1]|uniref:Uncharacterized protein n=1 Tax=Pestalotiopsis fici (strain W106-1 / CGMCC3.15140) TaxID=1229662 RepID=W3WS36_PESFW|nr:uncharacterized protein PFICI_12052 [Pestalotiopsis fici W106-1]ETS76665.1 hypothetical protein PFICI_12052 [Pestalotiopsis fici W106-1]